jgi:hypothetical protein
VGNLQLSQKESKPPRLVLGLQGSKRAFSVAYIKIVPSFRLAPFRVSGRRNTAPQVQFLQLKKIHSLHLPSAILPWETLHSKGTPRQTQSSCSPKPVHPVYSWAVVVLDPPGWWWTQMIAFVKDANAKAVQFPCANVTCCAAKKVAGKSLTL